MEGMDRRRWTGGGGRVYRGGMTVKGGMVSIRLRYGVGEVSYGI